MLHYFSVLLSPTLGQEIYLLAEMARFELAKVSLPYIVSSEVHSTKKLQVTGGKRYPMNVPR